MYYDKERTTKLIEYMRETNNSWGFFHCLCKYNTRIYALCNCLVVKDLAKCLQWSVNPGTRAVFLGA